MFYLKCILILPSGLLIIMPVMHIKRRITMSEKYTIPSKVPMSGKSVMRENKVTINPITDEIRLKIFMVP